ncbi:hypothetical protein BS47DRAFT_149604 [Hydnum rufescens UP504]|uniref:Fe2OG dioxygenase domain-containing protein n=1 Tax=Hydnum rufescens UP504 TaxID=1448309 RepID=A0A9P6DPZ0_9AGAM|nr:hypothetical protein BS47DRAFT_149604 [Hydnum rufescens UP504]
MKSCHALGAKLLESFALDMGLATDFFTSKHNYDQQQSSVLRLLYYPSINSNEFSSNTNMRAGSHSDYGTCTFLFQKDIGGLQILLPSTLSDPGPTWLDVPVIEDGILVNVGDLFDFWTGGKFKSTQHRVVAPRTAAEAQGRFSIAYFLHPADSERLVQIPLESDTGLDAKDERSALRRFGIPADAELTAKEWLLRRLGPTYSERKAAPTQMGDVVA